MSWIRIFLKLQEAHEGQQALLQKLQVSTL